jgi:hypothetical protein
VNHSSSLVSESPSGLDKVNNQKDFLAEGLTASCKSALHNPVLPSEFDLLDPRPAAKHRWGFADGNPAPLAKAMERLPIL